jgi:hypothetical protein
MDGSPYRSDDSTDQGQRNRTTLPEEDEQILKCLGAAVIMRWNTISTKLQRELFDCASTIGDLQQATPLKRAIARFLHNHKNDEQDQRPESNIDDMKAILAELPSTAREMAERDTGRWLMVGAWEVTKRLMRTNSAGELMDAPSRARYSG